MKFHYNPALCTDGSDICKSNRKAKWQLDNTIRIWFAHHQMVRWSHDGPNKLDHHRIMASSNRTTWIITVHYYVRNYTIAIYSEIHEADSTWHRMSTGHKNCRQKRLQEANGQLPASMSFFSWMLPSTRSMRHTSQHAWTLRVLLRKMAVKWLHSSHWNTQ